MSALAVWLAATRPRTLPAAAVPVAMGTALAWAQGGFHAPSALAALVGALLIQVGTNFANDYFDFKNGADTDARLGPVRATAAGLVTPGQMRSAFIAVFALAAAVGAYLVARGGWPIVVIGFFSILFGILYTGGPRPLGYLGLGEVLVLIFFGPVAVAGTGYVQSQTLLPGAILAGLAPGLLASAILVVNNLRDVSTDAVTGKHTLAVRFGSGFARAEYALFVALACAIPPAMYAGGLLPWGALAASLCAVPAARLTKRVLEEEGRALNPRLGQTGALMVAYGLLFALGVALTGGAG